MISRPQRELPFTSLGKGLPEEAAARPTIRPQYSEPGVPLPGESARHQRRAADRRDQRKAVANALKGEVMRQDVLAL